MILYHVTLYKRALSIIRHGIDPDRAMSETNKVVWLVTPGRLKWACDHIWDRHRARRMSDLCVLRVSVPRSRVKRARRGVWTCDRIIGADRYEFATGDPGVMDALLDAAYKHRGARNG